MQKAYEQSGHFQVSNPDENVSAAWSERSEPVQAAKRLDDYVQNTREELQSRIRELNDQRASYLAADRKRLAEKGKGDAFDEKVAEILHSQAARKGIQYGK